MSDQDRLLVIRAQNGDRAAFEELVSRHARPIYGFILRMVRGHREEAEDLTQEVLLRAYKALPRFRGDSKFSTWLHKIAVNRTLNRLQKRKLSSVSTSLVREDGTLAVLDIPDSSMGPERLAGRSETMAMIEQALGELSDSLRVVFVMRELQAMSHDDIARSLGCTSQAVRVRHHRAKKELAKRLAPYLGVEASGVVNSG